MFTACFALLQELLSRVVGPGATHETMKILFQEKS
jgi:hypothetical protein